MVNITDKSFRYTPSFNTDLRKRFRRMAQEERAKLRSPGTGGDLGGSVVRMVVRQGASKT